MNDRTSKRLIVWTASYLVLMLSGCHGGKQTRGDHPRTSVGVTMSDVDFYSTALGRTMPYRVYLPVSLKTGRDLPVVYLLHGGGADYRSWSNDSDVVQYARAGLILVMPEGDESYYMNEVESTRNRFEDYITRDLMADVEHRFPARKDRQGRAILGISMGGFAAVEYALSQPQLFVFVGALSPSIDVPFRRFNVLRIGQWWKFRNIFGPAGSSERSQRNPFQLVRSADPKRTPYIYMTVGEQESLFEPNRRFAALLQRHGFAYEFHTKPGGHDWGDWNEQIPGFFSALSRYVSQSPN